VVSESAITRTVPLRYNVGIAKAYTGCVDDTL